MCQNIICNLIAKIKLKLQSHAIYFQNISPHAPTVLPTLPQVEGEMAPLFASDLEAVRPKIGCLVRAAQVHSQYSVVSSVRGKEIFTFTQILSLSAGWLC